MEMLEHGEVQVDVVASRDAVDVSQYVLNGEWSLLSADMGRHAVVASSSAVYPDITVSLHISRRLFYYLVNIIVPCVWLNPLPSPHSPVQRVTSSPVTSLAVWLNLLSLLAFCMPPDAGEKASYDARYVDG